MIELLVIAGALLLAVGITFAPVYLFRVGAMVVDQVRIWREA